MLDKIKAVYTKNVYGEYDAYEVRYYGDEPNNGELIYKYEITERYKTGKIKTRTETLGDGTVIAWEYHYDGFGRLDYAIRNNVKREYSYDSNGNRTYKPPVYEYTFDKQDRLITETTGSACDPLNYYSYLPDGTMLGYSRPGMVGSYQRTYNVFGNITTEYGGPLMSLMHEYKHDAFKRLIAKDDKRYHSCPVNI